MSRFLSAGLVALGLGAALGACGSDGDGGAGAQQRPAGPSAATSATTVQIKQFRYQPDKVGVPAGATVSWTNDDDILHTVTAEAPGQPQGKFDKELPEKGSMASVTFDSPGTFAYFCSRRRRCGAKSP